MTGTVSARALRTAGRLATASPLADTPAACGSTPDGRVIVSRGLQRYLRTT